MAFTQTDLDNIDTAIATGELSVEVNGRKATYRSIGDLMKARALIVTALANAGNAQTPVRRGSYRVTFATHRGD